MRTDTIAAIATPPGEGAVGIVRISGPDAETIGRMLFDRHLTDRRAVFGRMLDPETGKMLDEGLAVLMRGPRSYTGEDTIELNGHGGVRSLERLLEATLRAGARAAQPGEFTLRAFLNGRLDLTQAEAVLGVVQARTDAAVDLALGAVDGGLGGRIRDARSRALESLAYLGARADFPDEDVPLRDLSEELSALACELDALVAGAEYGILQRQGVRIAIVGRPNAGKSSLLNRLLGEPRAIVTEIAGTTRDTIEESADLLGLPVVLTDTAGIHETDDPIERAGMERTHAAAGRSEVIVVVIDATRPLAVGDAALLTSYAGRRLVVALNKVDLGAVVLPDAPVLSGAPAMPVSALTGDGIPQLVQILHAVALAGARPPDDGAALATIRQRDAARRAAEHVRSARDGYRAGAPEDLLAVDLGAAVRALGELTGDDATEDMLDTIFSRFCIGK